MAWAKVMPSGITFALATGTPAHPARLDQFHAGRAMMKAFVGTILVVLVASSSAGASPCAERMNPLEVRINEASEVTASVSSGGQGVAAARQGQAMQARNQGEPISPPNVPPFQDAAKEAQTTRQAERSGGGGDRIIQARAQLNRARALDQQGDAQTCLQTVEEIERLLKPSP